MQSGTTLGHFRIVEPLGSGGMGEVYRATDERLRRDVAIKILPESFAADPERLARFEREARSLAALNHKAIAAVYSVDAAPLVPPEGEGVSESSADGSAAEQHFLVMELVPGETLAQRIRRGPLPIPEVISFSRQIAEALEAAHARGIVHRDLKPGNVMVTPEGAVKVLDFGLAKALAPQPGTEGDLTHSPTLSLEATRQGVLLGTAAYMSPEQARGESADARADLWALGVVIWEMLTGRRPFGGDTLSDTLAEVLKVEPPWDELPTTTPEPLSRLLRRCLVKSPRDRQHSAADARIALSDLDAEVSRPVARRTVRAETSSRFIDWRWVVVAVAGVIVGAAVAALFLRGNGPGHTEARLSGHFSILTPPDAPVATNYQQPLALSPDGKTVVYLGSKDSEITTRLYARGRNEFAAHAIEGTEHASGPFFSPDGEWIGFFDRATLKLKKVPLRGGSPVDLAPVSQAGRGGSWGADGRIVFAPSWISGLFMTSAAGGPPKKITEPDEKGGIKTHRYPKLLPDESAVLYTKGAADILSFDDADIVAESLTDGRSRVLVHGGAGPEFLAPNILLYSRAGQIFAAPMDMGELSLTATPVPVLGGVLTADALGMPNYAISKSGDLVYLPGSPDHFYTRMVSIDLQGQVKPLPLDPRLFAAVRFSPDGKELALNMEGANATLWRYNLDRGTLVRLTGIWDTNDPEWSPDGRRIVADLVQGEDVELVVLPADGSSPPTSLASARDLNAQRLRPTSWSSDGRWVALTVEKTGASADIWIIPMNPAGKPKPLLQSPFNEGEAGFSPDGKWIVYQSDETGRYEIYVRPVDRSGGAIPISADGGFTPIWSRDGRYLYYRSGDSMMQVDVQEGSELSFGRPRSLFELDEVGRPSRVYDLAPDGSHFVDIVPGPDDQPLNEIRVILNWGAEVRAALAGAGNG